MPRLPRTLGLLMLLCLGASASGCTTAGTTAANGSASASATPVDSQALLYGDDAFKARLQQALAAKGKSYVPRTKHKNADGSPKYTNRLILETSPYLHQHAHNPVNWFAWGEEAFNAARTLGRPIFLSVGYSTCHWCHVMEEESFEDEEVARYMNEHYVCIKVDREERPDVDAIYMRAVQMLTRRGGWPMSVWLTPDKRPFYGGTYFPARDGDRGSSKGFLTLLREQRDAYAKDPKGVNHDAGKLARQIKRDMEPPASAGQPTSRTIHRAYRDAVRRYDSANGGSRGRPKFPSNFPTRLMFRYALRTGNEQARDMALTTLRKMAAGGMYDHVAGGFHRYSTDAKWLVPHFEKMLYDNALLAVAYLEGFQLSGDADLARVAREILDYVAREMTAPDGGFYSATDADSIGPKGHREEGYYFTWTPAELDKVLDPKQAELVKAYYAVSARGNFEGRNLLHTPERRAAIAKRLKLDRKAFDDTLRTALLALRTARNKRPAPLRDDKIQADWNGLMISAFARAARVLDEPRYLAVASKAAGFIDKQLVKDGRLRHSYLGGQTGALAFAEDLAFFAAGLLDLFEASQQSRWLELAIARMDDLEKHHANTSTGGYFRTSGDHEKLLAREQVSRDGAQPNGNSIALMNHLRLSTLTMDDRWRTLAETTMRAFASKLENSPASLDQMMLAIDWFTDSPKEVVLVLPDAAAKDDGAELRAVLQRRFLPNHAFAQGSPAALGALAKRLPWVKDKPTKGDEPTAYVCEKGACELPTNDPKVLAKQLAKIADYPSALERR
jgi:uncharacterized protein YyaL (SSP411 family)